MATSHWETKPQTIYNIYPDNSNYPFHHPIQSNFSPSEFIDSDTVLQQLKLKLHQVKDKHINSVILSLDSTPFTLVEDEKTLSELARKLSCVDEFAVDLEHNSYRSFLGLTCLMQISTRDEDFVVDTLKLYHFIGPYLRHVFSNPNIKKVMHGACNDVLWLQRDFGIYVRNMFDTMQASKVMKLKRNSLAHLLEYFCGVIANKQYQTADWRKRPLPDDMVKYAREDTHYLLYIYDKMRDRLAWMRGKNSEYEDPLLEVYKRSTEVCSKLYEKVLITPTSYLDVPGIKDANLTSEQLVVAKELFEWRERLARNIDESIDYVMPNELLLKIVKEMPTSAEKLFQITQKIEQQFTCPQRVDIVRHPIHPAPVRIVRRPIHPVPVHIVRHPIHHAPVGYHPLPPGYVMC